MDSEEARKKIIEYVAKDLGCTAQNIVDGVQDSMSRTLVFFYIGELVEEKILEDKKLNRREHRFFVNSANPLVLVERELDELEARFTQWINEVREKFYNQRSLWEKTNREEDFIQVLYIWRTALLSVNHIFSHIFNTYSTKALSEWSKVSSDREYLDKLYSTLFSKLYRIMSNLSRAFPTIAHERADMWLGLRYRMDLMAFREMKGYLHRYQLDNQEFCDLMTTIWKISEDIFPGNKMQRDELAAVGWKEVFENPSKYP